LTTTNGASRTEHTDQEKADPTKLATLYKHLRVTDVVDAMDGIGYFDIGLVSREVRPLWLGMTFWGPAATIRSVPANRPMWTLDSTEDIVAAHKIWYAEVGRIGLPDDLEPGHVVVQDTGGAREVGFWGSSNAMGAMVKGAVGIVSDGYCRDTAEIALQRTPVCARRGRTIIPGRIQTVEVQGTIACGGVQVRPGDIVGCDDDGVVVVPLEVAEQVATHARAILLADMHSRRKHYQALNMAPDSTVDIEAIEAYYQNV
jgi:4-hydroxy-4-methyl-2-oxoglutarate aldolase